MRAHGADVADPDPKTGDMTTPHGTSAEAENDPPSQAGLRGLQGQAAQPGAGPEKNR
jgi:hypothetical protein